MQHENKTDYDDSIVECLTCEHIGKDCNGPNFNAMELDDVYAFLQQRRTRLGLAYQNVCDITTMSMSTIQRILGGSVKDPSFVSLRELSAALICDKPNVYPCKMGVVSKKLQDYVADNAEVERVQLQALHEAEQQNKFLSEQLETKNEQFREHEEHIQEQREAIKRSNRIIRILAIALSVTVLVIITALIIDRLNYDIGFFWVKN